MAEFTQKGGLKKLLKLNKDVIARMYIADLNRFQNLNSDFLNSTVIETESPAIVSTRKKKDDDLDEAITSLQEDYNAIDLFQSFVNRSNTGNDITVNIVRDKSTDILNISETQPVVEKTVTNEEFVQNSNATSNTVNNMSNDILNICETQPVDTELIQKENYPFQEKRKEHFKFAADHTQTMTHFLNKDFTSSEKAFFYSEDNSDWYDKIVFKFSQLDRLNTITSRKLFDLEVKNTALDQYSRRNNIEIGGIPDYIEQHELESTVIEILYHIKVDVSWSDIEGCHRLFKNQRSKGPAKVIIRMVNRKHAIKALRNKKLMKSINFSNIAGLGNAKLFVCENLCASYRSIYDAAYKLLKRNVIKHLWTFKGVIHIRVHENDNDFLVFTHIDDLLRKFAM